MNNEKIENHGSTDIRLDIKTQMIETYCSDCKSLLLKYPTNMWPNIMLPIKCCGKLRIPPNST